MTTEKTKQRVNWENLVEVLGGVTEQEAKKIELLKVTGEETPGTIKAKILRMRKIAERVEREKKAEEAIQQALQKRLEEKAKKAEKVKKFLAYCESIPAENLPMYFPKGKTFVYEFFGKKCSYTGVRWDTFGLDVDENGKRFLLSYESKNGELLYTCMDYLDKFSINEKTYQLKIECNYNDDYEFTEHTVEIINDINS